LGTVVNAYLTRSIVRNSDGSYTISATANYNTESLNPIVRIHLADADNSSSYLGDITKGILVYDVRFHREEFSPLGGATGAAQEIASPSTLSEGMIGESNIQIGYNQIPLRSVSTSVTSENSLYPHTNLFLGGSAIFYQRGTAGTETNFDFNLPADTTDEVTYLYLRGIRETTNAAGSFSVVVRGREFDNNFAAGSEIIMDFGQQGPNCGLFNEDWIGKVFASKQYRFIRVVISTPVSTLLTIRKMFLGKLFSFERSPSYPYERNFLPSELSFASDSLASKVCFESSTSFFKSNC
jgi:hypothetical protein